MTPVLLLTSLFVSTAAHLASLDYCSLKCNGFNHTMCEYPAGGGPLCTDFQSGLENTELHMILDLHNTLRQKVATGAESTQPPSSNMQEVIWDPEAAIIAQRWADQCDLFGHDQCRRTLHEEHVGQNIAWMKGRDYPGRTKSRQDIIRYFILRWYGEVDNYNGSIEDYDPLELSNTHYTQLVWARTTEIGCGFVQWTTDTEYEYKLVCNYVPGGNIPHEEVYKQGEPCSQCLTHSQCSQQYPGLCLAVDWSRNGDLPDDLLPELTTVISPEPESDSHISMKDVKEDTTKQEDSEINKDSGHILRPFILPALLLFVLTVHQVN